MSHPRGKIGLTDLPPRRVCGRGRGRPREDVTDMPQVICSVDGCDRPSRAFGFCTLHYRRWRKDPATLLLPPPSPRDPVCTYPGCERAHYARGYCAMHYQRWRITGSLEPRPPRVRGESFANHFRMGAPDQCWLWTGSVAPNGYGRLASQYAHRLSYERFYGPIPDGMDVCHHCDTRLCVNPSCLFIGTRQDNMTDMVNKGRHSTYTRTHCKNGHPWTPENILIFKGQRRCRECKRLESKRWRDKQRALKVAL